jgi:hypothetical protein
VQKRIVDSAARDFGTSESLELQEYFVYFKIPNCTIGSKDPAQGGKAFQTRA